jgi:hypothetical protein
MQIHILVAFSASTRFHEARSTTLDLHSASGFLLDMLDIRAAMTNDLGTEVKAWQGLKIDWNPLLGPFTLLTY